MKKAFSIITVLVLLVVVFWLGSHSNNPRDSKTDTANVSEKNGKQIINITAKAGYSPRLTTAKAGVPTTIEMQTNSTFDCSSAVVIPSLNYRKYLPATGITSIEVPAQTKGTKLQGLCAMGMYNFTIQFN